VAANVLSDVLESFGYELYVQGCSTQCKFMFGHTPMRLILDSDLEDEYALRSHAGQVIFGSHGVGGGVQAAAHAVAWALSGDLSEFATCKNIGRRMLDLDASVRTDLVHLLHHYQRHTELVAERRSWQNIKDHWSNRKWRSHARDLIAQLWLSISHFATLKQMWDEAARNLNETDTRDVLLLGDFFNDAEAIEGLTYSDILASIGHVAAGLDNRAVVSATAWGALAGGLVGGLAGAASNVLK
jgi:hypothetical protein